MFDWSVTLYLSKQLELSEECRAYRVLSNTIICFFGQQVAADSNSRQHTRLRQSSYPQIKLGSVLGMPLIILRRRRKRVVFVFSCVCFQANSVVPKMLIQGPGNLLCFAVELGFFLRDHSTPFTTTVATGPATAEYKRHRISTAHVGTAPP